MIASERRGDLFSLRCQTLVITTNEKGAMGKGIARRARDLYPDLYRGYKSACKRDQHRVGRPDMYPVNDGFREWVLLFPTKKEWWDGSKIEWIEQGLRSVIQRSLDYPFNQIESLALPPLGCGNGGLDYHRDVRPLIYQYLDPWWVEVHVISH